MRRAQNAHTSPYSHNSYGAYSDTEHMGEENESLTAELKDKVKTLKSLTIDIGNEVRTQNSMLGDMDDDFHKSGNFLERSMKRLGIISKGSHNYHILILFLFCFVVFLLLWVALKFR
ncbi:BET1 homolog isoform X1 [Macrobrachium rosenbergii]|uniref:BET1 homolog isoform X1 n=1 Tax=Macrobrachium rosenbergii TaxID=79674 RepID=UPI0034D5DF78